MRSMGIKNKDLVGHAVIKECKLAMAPAILFYFFSNLTESGKSPAEVANIRLKTQKSSLQKILQELFP